MMAETILYLVVLLVGFASCRAAAALVARLELVDLPNERSSHEQPTPRGGGIGILAVLLPGMIAGSLMLSGSPAVPVVLAIAGATLVLAVLGYVDDRHGVGPVVKLVPQVLAAVGVVLVAGAVQMVPLPYVGDVDLGVAAPVLTVLWLIAFSNGFNFMDGIDGIAALHAGVAGLFLAGAGLISGGEGSAWLSLPLSASCLAFLSVNWFPAKVFMGDVGSLPLGFLLALGAALTTPFVTGFLILGPFLFDTAYTLVRRALRRENLLSAHRSHLYQRLVLSGWSHARVSLLYGGWTVLTGALGLLYLLESPGARIPALLGAAASGAGMILLVHRCERNRGAGH